MEKNYRQIKFEVEFTTPGFGIQADFLRKLLYDSGVGE